MNKELTISFIFFIIAVVGIIIIIVGKSAGSTKTKRVYVKNKKQLTNDNKYLIENINKIEKIFKEKYKELEPLKNNVRYSIFVMVLVFISLFFIKNEIYTYISFGGALIYLMFSIYNYQNGCNRKYADIVKEVLHDYNSDLEYKPTEGFTASEYKLCHFPETCDRLYSEDMIVNLKKGFHFADIIVESKHYDEDGGTYYQTEYEGSLARVYIKDIGCKIFLGGINVNSYFNKDYVKIELENDEFNDLFMAYTDNELLAYKILTPDVMEQFVKIKYNTYGDIDIRIINNMLYVRFFSGNGFDSSSFFQKEDQENLFKSIAVLEEVMKTMDKVKSIIDKKSV